MPNKVQAYVQKANEMSAGITRDPEAWMQFLHHSARFYKYTFNDQLLIYAQRPEATACASYDVWNNIMHRYVRRGAKGIALLNPTDNGILETRIVLSFLAQLCPALPLHLLNEKRIDLRYLLIKNTLPRQAPTFLPYARFRPTRRRASRACRNRNPRRCGTGIPRRSVFHKTARRRDRGFPSALRSNLMFSDRIRRASAEIDTAAQS